MGRTDTPVRQVFDKSMERFLPDLPLVYVQTVVARDDNEKLVLRGLHIGKGREPFERAAETQKTADNTKNRLLEDLCYGGSEEIYRS